LDLDRHDGDLGGVCEGCVQRATIRDANIVHSGHRGRVGGRGQRQLVYEPNRIGCGFSPGQIDLPCFYDWLWGLASRCGLEECS
jgi:hypothetical protein